jgi:hypothetical protein
LSLPHPLDTGPWTSFNVLFVLHQHSLFSHRKPLNC